ncbi:hypothetical protein JCM11641_006973 [Rhodosporidiobolus odoratus]
MRPTLSLVPVLAIVTSLPLPISASASPVDAIQLNNPFTTAAAASTAFLPSLPSTDSLTRLTKRIRRAAPILLWTEPETEADEGFEAANDMIESADQSENAEDDWTAERWAEERLHEEREEREMWRELLKAVSATGVVSPLFEELVREEGAGQVVLASPDPSGAQEAKQIRLDAKQALHQAPPPSLVSPPVLGGSSYHVPSQSVSSDTTLRNLKVVFSSAFSSLRSLLPQSLTHRIRANSTALATSLPSIPLPSLVTLPLESLKALPPSLRLSFAAPAGIGLSR